MSVATKWIFGTIVTGAALIWALYFFDVLPWGTEDSCNPPAQIARANKRELELAASQLGELASGKVSLKQDSAVVKLLSDGSQDLMIFGYLMCKAMKTGQIDPGNREQFERTQAINAFLATHPPPEEFTRFLKSLQAPPPTGRLEVPELSIEGDKRVLALSGRVHAVSLFNAGEADVAAWLRNNSPGKLVITPVSHAALKKHESARVEIGLLAPPESGPWFLSVGSSTSEQELPVEVRLVADEREEALLEDLARDLLDSVGEVAGTAPGPAPDAGATPADGNADYGPGASWIARRAHATVKAKYPQASEQMLWAVTGAVLEQVNWNGPALVAYRTSRDALGDAASELDLPVGRALLLANVEPDPARKERPISEVLDPADQARLSSLRMARGNALVSRDAALAEMLAEGLGQKPALAPFAMGLTGDVAMVNAPEAAVAAYDACAQATGAPSCTLRKAEAQVVTKDGAGAKRTLSDMAATTPPASRNAAQQVSGIAVRQVEQLRGQ